MLGVQRAPTRQAVLFVHAAVFRERTGTSHEAWSERVDAVYCQRVPEQNRQVKAPGLHDRMNPALHQRLLRAWDQKIYRYENGEQHLPAELEEAWVFALDEPFRTDCIRELSQRLGCYGAQIREPGAGGDHTAWGDALGSWGQITVLMGKVLADGRIDEHDREQLRALVPSIRSAQADLETLLRRAVEQSS